MHRLIERAGEEPFSEHTIRVLCEPTDPRIVDIRPDGLIYVSHSHYRDRLDRAFGPGAWALVPLAPPTLKGNRMCWYGFLKARGQYVCDAIGGARFSPNNAAQNYDDAAEAAKSDCLVRCCKALPMFRELWDKEWAEKWVRENAELVTQGRGGGERVWKKKGTAMRNFDVRPGRLAESEYDKPMTVEVEAKAHMAALTDERREAKRIESQDVYRDRDDDRYQEDRLQHEEEWGNG